ncbi:hypothetical protein MMF93_26420 [Streptomyces tubbatahanensis]|uniref:Uncharacterized protein n=1 Tax=Streptomyces tubbatahanensis TaxID=2923272 RepID=A0ABY3XYP8_9ACTN|nr:hypothetical protein [Streptomyces tubbatahanensis]UNS99587.1 hypothetical protein MMF93_26420 [Streptomyces tubbatahanensis]
MSERYEVVVTCFLREDTPSHVLEALRWHLGASAARPGGLEEEAHPYPFLEPDPGSPLPGGDYGVLRGEDHHAWGLFSRTCRHEDDLGQLDALLGLLAPYAAEPGYGGHVRTATADPSQPGAAPSLLTFADGAYVLAPAA